LANTLNLAETVEHTGCHFFGAWVTDPDNDNMTFVSFLPAVAYQPGLLGRMVWSMAVRAQWTKAYFAGKEGLLTLHERKSKKGSKAKRNSYRKISITVPSRLNTVRTTGQNPLQLPRELQNLLVWQILEKNHPEVLSQSPKAPVSN
jgi:hypothetical protein